MYKRKNVLFSLGLCPWMSLMRKQAIHVRMSGDFAVIFSINLIGMEAYFDRSESRIFPGVRCRMCHVMRAILYGTLWSCILPELRKSTAGVSIKAHF